MDEENPKILQGIFKEEFCRSADDAHILCSGRNYAMNTGMELFDFSSPSYSHAFQILIRCCDQRMIIREFLARQIHSLSPPVAKEDLAIDWGAGTGALTQELVRHFRRVAAVEPLAEFRAQLQQACPTADVYEGTILAPQFPRDLGLARFSVCVHVLYHIADEDWAAHILHAASFLAVGGQLIVVLSHPGSGCQRMIAEFGGRKFDLYAVASELGMRREFSLHYLSLKSTVRTTAFADTLALARFMVSDRPATQYGNLPTEAEFQAYVRRRFWDEKTQIGGWDLPNVALVMTKLD
jgi:hypothetical protein